VAVKIDRVEREFILGAATEGKTSARIQAAGRTLSCKLSSAGKDRILLSPTGGESPALAHRERVSVYFDYAGQGVAFDAPVIKAGKEGIELGLPDAMYRSLSRRWPRVPPPNGLVVDFLLPDAELVLDCPTSEEWADVELPELREGLDSRDMASLVQSFKDKAQTMASEGRVTMFKDKPPADVAEEMASRLGRVLYVPSTLSAIPLADPYPAGRIVTREMAEDFEGPSALAGGSRLAGFLSSRSAVGLRSAIWCPILYYRYAIGIVYMANGADRPRALDFSAVDLAWEFSRVLAWFLKRHGYFAAAAATVGQGDRGSVLDASPSGLLAALPMEGPRLGQGSTVNLRLVFGDKQVVCPARIARRYEEGGSRFYGLAFQGLSAADMALIGRGLYGDFDAVPRAAGG
jgi:hypothetical protein